MKICIVGARTGIGKELARLFKQKNNQVIGTTREQTALPYCDQTIQADLLDVNELWQAIEPLSIDVLVLCAAQITGDFKHMLAVNTVAPIELAERYIEQCLQAKRRGTIMMICSTASLTPQPFMATYAATKSALFTYTTSRHVEVSEHGLTLMAVCPGATDTKALESWRNHFSKWERKWIMQPRVVAKAIYRAYQKRTPVAIVGWRNRVSVCILRWLPYAWQARLLHAISKKMKEE